MSEAVMDISWLRRGYRFVQTTLIAGLVFLAPLAVMAWAASKAFALLKRLARPLSALLPVDSTIWGVVVADAIALALVVVICFLGGLLARASFAGHFLKKAETGILWRIPGYGFIKALTDSLDKRAGASTLKPVLIHFDDAAQLAFEVDRLPDGRRVIYIPSSPDPRAGSVMVMDAARVEPAPLTFMATLRSLRALGRGLGPMLGALPPT